MACLLIRDVRNNEGVRFDMLVEDGRIARAAAVIDADDGWLVEDGAGALALPGFVEGHTHLDKTHWGMRWYRNAVAPSLPDRIENERRWRATSGHDAGAQSLALARAFLAAGTTRLRTHVDIDTDAGLRHLHGVLATRDTLRERMEMQIVAFPQSGVLKRPGTDTLLADALRAGADLLGGIDPCAIDGDAVQALDLLFGLAERHGVGLDIHLHERSTMGAYSLDLILQRTAALGMQGKVAISHAFCLGDIDVGARDALLARMSELRVAVVTTAPASVAVPSVAACRAAGVTVIGGNDGIRDTWTPYGSPDMLERAMLIGMRNDFRRDDDLEIALDCVTHSAARGCGFANYGLLRGNRADLVLVDAQTPAHAVVARPVRKLVVSAGRIVARNGALV
ncbi:amidohydrolase family protein [Paraburkholderia rhizosphaerae]|uniref:Cytosine/adenosine deaminase-related metal-dependent hydrolase n=1 Tax=Paraburkholderia rhizosphaerae TaxID=480658 RepID=A0A4R8L819_9BURK|nr:amidohydrolase family protein [Paraburkholderia rhizosphaerae]TDY38841.1 cytosine/adenosine deaminase-related metal-dependent hydrolase [Paraburkholderia rhizosphaerae]